MGHFHSKKLFNILLTNIAVGFFGRITVKKMIVLTTEWLPWLQTNWGACGYEPKSYFTTDNLNICEGVTRTTLQKN